jgi:hypothetical protein
MLMFCYVFIDYVYVEKFIEPQTAIREALFSLLSPFFTVLAIEEYLFHGLMN